MNKTILSILAIALFAFSANSQDDGAKLAKSAGKALTSYNIDPNGNADKLVEAKDKIDRAMQTPEAQALGSAWQTKGEIYATMLSKEMVKAQLDPNYKMVGDNDALVAFEAFKKAHELAAKKYEKQDALKGITENNLQTALLNIGGQKYEAQDFYRAFLSFRAALESHKLLHDAGEKSFFDDQAQYDNYVYYAGFCASKAGKCAEAYPMIESFFATGRAKADVYDLMFQCKTAAGDEAGAEAILAEGRKKFPDDAALLFSEINIYLKKGKLSELTGRLEQAIAKEPNNISLYVTLGSIYDNLYQKGLEDKNTTDTDKYFELAKKTYTDALGKDPKNVDATYAMGALYYNKAAIRTKELNAMPEDYSAAGIKKYEAAKKEIEALFDQALPFFQKAEGFDPNDMNTLIALKEIYTRKEDELALEFKKRLDNVQAGNKNTTPYFKQ